MSSINGSPGTITAIVEKVTSPGSKYLLCCQHVLQSSSRNTSPYVCQPADEDDGYQGRFNVVAKITETGMLDPTTVNSLDGAIAKLTEDVDATNFVPEFGFITTIAPVPAGNADILICGRVSGKSAGSILNEEINLELQYGNYGIDLLVRFSTVYRADYASEPGDSGAPVIDRSTNELVGMHIAGSGDGKAAFFCPILPVFEYFQIGLA